MITHPSTTLSTLQLTIVTLATGCVSDEPRLRRLVDQIRSTGARVCRIFPSVDILTIESSQEQSAAVRHLKDVEAMDFRPVNRFVS